MRFSFGFTVLILLGTALFFPACKGDTGPTGPEGTGWPTPTPVCSSPSTFGVTSAGAVTGINPNYLVADRIQLSAPANAVSLSFLVAAGPVSGQVRMGIYSGNASAPSLLVVQAGPQNVVAGWNTLALPGVYLPPGYYWLTYLFSSTTNELHNNTGGTCYYYNYGWGELPTAFPSGIPDTLQNTLYLSACP